MPRPRQLIAFVALACSALVGAAAAAAAAAAPRIGIQGGTLSVGAADGSGSRKYDLAPPAPLAEIIALERDSVLKLAFTAVTLDGSSAASTPLRPAQAHVQFKDVETGEVASYPVTVKGRGKARFDLKATLLPTFLQSSSGTLTATLYLAGSVPSSSDAEATPVPTPAPLAYPLLTLRLAPASLVPAPPHARDRHALPPQPGMPAFRAQPPIAHTFAQGERVVGALKSALGTAGVVLAPWAVLLLLLPAPLRALRPSLSSAPSRTTPLLLLGLAALEALILVYWTRWTLGPFIPAFCGAAGATAYVGKRALGAEQARRLGGAAGLKSAGAGAGAGAGSSASGRARVEVVPAGTIEPQEKMLASASSMASASASTPAAPPVLARTTSVEPASAQGTPVKSRKKGKAQAQTAQ